MARPTIMRGSTGQAVKDAQQNLADRGYPVGPTGVDGIFGNHTYHAVIRYQTDRATGECWALSLPLAIDGIVGPQTWARLDPDKVKKGDSGFQNLVSLPNNGVVDSKTWMYLWS